MPKLYFNDTGLACSLLGIKQKEQVSTHYLYGVLFENFIINEFYKHLYNNAINQELCFWRNKIGKEIDLIIDNNDNIIPIEIKAGKTFNIDYFKNLIYLNKLSENTAENTFVIYGGEKSYKTKDGNILSWNNFNKIFEFIDD